MTLAVACLLWGLIATCALTALAVAVIAAVDFWVRGDRDTDRAWAELDAARNVTGRVPQQLREGPGR